MGETPPTANKRMKVYIIADNEDRLYDIENAILHNGDTFHVSLESMKKCYKDAFFMGLDKEKEKDFEEIEKHALKECGAYYSDFPNVVVEGMQPYLLLV